MKNKMIKINSLTDLSNFIVEASKVKGDVLAYGSRFTANAKSFVDMMSVNLNYGARIEYPADAKDFEKYISQFEIY